MEATDPTLPRTVVGGVPLSQPERHRAYIATLQRDLNRHRRRLGATERLAVDGEWDEHTDTSFREICRVLGLAPERNVRTFRLIAGAAEALTDAERALAGTEGATFEQELRERFLREAAANRALSKDERESAYIAALQRDLNRHLVRRGERPRIPIDGKWDAETDAAFRAICRALRVEPERTVRTYRLIAGAAARPMRARADLTVLGGRSLPRAEREKAFIAAVQRDLNQHLVRLGSPAILAVDGEWAEHTERAFRRVCKVLGVEPARGLRAYRLIAGDLEARSESELQRAKTEGTDYERRLRRHFAHQKVVVESEKPKPGSDKQSDTVDRLDPGGPASTERERRIAALIRKHGGRYGEHIIAASARSGVPVSLICGVLEQETHFSNVFGHDTVRNPVKSPPGSNRPVTEKLYREYRRFRDQGLGCQGVGPMQLTSKFLQDAADKQGGCWRVGPNIRVGVAFLATCIKQAGSVRGGLVRYNGGSTYPDKVLPLAAKWKQRLGAAAGVAAPTSRTFRLTKPRMKGDDILDFQRLLNKRFRSWRVPDTLGEDGEFGPETRRAARQVAHGLGLAAAEYEHGITPAVRVLIRDPDRRSPGQRAAFERRAGFRKKLRALRAKDLAAGDPDDKKALPGKVPAGMRGQAYAEARKLVGVMEQGGNNRGRKVEEIIRFAGGVVGEPWCVNFLIWCYGHAGSKVVRRGYTRAVRFMLAPPGVVRTTRPRRGDMVRFSFDHTGMFVKDNGNGTITTIEGNTGRTGAVSDSKTGGDGVYVKVRSKSSVTDYLRVTR